MRRNPYFLAALTVLVVAVVYSLCARGVLGWTVGLLYIAYDTFLLAFVGLTVARVLRRPEPEPVSAAPIAIAVLVPARDEREGIGACLEAVLPQLGPHDELYVIDDGSSDGTVAALERAWDLGPAAQPLAVSRRDPRVRVWAKAHTGKADSLNRVWGRLEAEVVVTLDADTLPEPGSLDCVRCAFGSDPGLVAAGGTLVPTCRGNGGIARLLERFQRFEYVRAFLARLAWMERDSLLLVSGAFAAYRRTAVSAVGGFSTDSLVEDYELVHRLHRYRYDHALDWRIAVLVGARAVTDSPDGLVAFLRQRRRWFGGFLQTHFADADMVGNPRYGTLGRWLLPIKTLDTLQPIYGIASFALLVRIALCGWGFDPWIARVLVGKLAIDLGFHMWSIRLYGRWQRLRIPRRTWVESIGITLTEPLSFQLLRHLGAVWGWRVMLRRRDEWTPLPARVAGG